MSRTLARMTERPFVSAEWRYLAMLNYEIAPSALGPYLPAGTELDDFEGRTFVSVVGFRFFDTRVMGIPVPFHRDFEEVNLRFYVRRAAAEGWRRGVVFVRELVPKDAIAWVARMRYNEPYRALPMRHRVDMDAAPHGAPGLVRYEWCDRGRWDGLEASTAGMPAQPAPGSEAEFITEHYWGYTAQPDGGTKEYRVAHERWPVWSAAKAALHCDALRLYGAPFVEALGAPPHSAFVARGSEVSVYAGSRV